MGPALERTQNGTPEHTSEHATGFTAVNGRSSPSIGHDNENNGSHSNPSRPEVEVEQSNNRKRKTPDANGPPSPKRHSPTRPNDHDNFPGLVNGHSSSDQYVEARSQWSQAHQPEEYNLGDDQLAAALQRSTHEMTQSLSGDSNGDGKYPGTPQQQHQHVDSAHVSPGMTSSLVQKQRKRNFSNRTKTGCMTCRERKKKCDEAKPRCNNCERGGFFCKGYSQTTPIYKQQSINHPPPLQAKNGYYEPPAAFPPFPARPGPNGEYYEASPNGRSQSNHQEDDRDRRSATEARVPTIRSNTYRPGWPETSIQYGSESSRSEYPPAPHITDLSRDQKKLPQPASFNHPPMQRSHSSHRDSPADMAQMALEHTVNHVPPPPQYRSEKDKMLQGLPYKAQDAELLGDKRLCRIAREKFNKIDSSELTEDQIINKFMDVLRAKKSSPTVSPQHGFQIPRGSVGDRLQIEGPLFCDYGYNIHIGDDCEIGANFTVQYGGLVKIGHRVVIGPNVTFVAGEADGDQSRRAPDNKRAIIPKPIVIQDNVHIEANSVVLGGSTIQSNVTARGLTRLGSKIVGTNLCVYNDHQLKDEQYPGTSTSSYMIQH